MEEWWQFVKGCETLHNQKNIKDIHDNNINININIITSQHFFPPST